MFSFEHLVPYSWIELMTDVVLILLFLYLLYNMSSPFNNIDLQCIHMCTNTFLDMTTELLSKQYHFRNTMFYKCLLFYK